MTRIVNWHRPQAHLLESTPPPLMSARFLGCRMIHASSVISCLSIANDINSSDSECGLPDIASLHFSFLWVPCCSRWETHRAWPDVSKLQSDYRKVEWTRTISPSAQPFRPLSDEALIGSLIGCICKSQNDQRTQAGVPHVVIDFESYFNQALRPHPRRSSLSHYQPLRRSFVKDSNPIERSKINGAWESQLAHIFWLEDDTKVRSRFFFPMQSRLQTLCLHGQSSTFRLQCFIKNTRAIKSIASNTYLLRDRTCIPRLSILGSSWARWWVTQFKYMKVWLTDSLLFPGDTRHL